MPQPRTAALVLAALLAVGLPRGASAALLGFAEDCTGATLDGSATLPVTTSMLNGGDADFTMPAGCQLGATAFSDAVVCFTPTNNCTVQFQCSNSGGSNTRASVVGGPCSTTFTTCHAGGTDTVPPNPSLASFALTGGTSYCFVCQNTIGNGVFDATITATAGDCGALPVGLLAAGVDEP